MKTGIHCRYLAILSITFIVTACGVTPQTKQSLAAYTAAMEQVEVATDKFLVDFADADKLKQTLEESLAPDSANTYPSSFKPELLSDVSVTGVSDDIQQRRVALARVSAYNDALVALAEGQPESVIKSRLDTFGGGIQSVLGTVGISAGATFSAALAGASKIGAMIQNGLNAAQFKDAIAEGKPVVEGILLKFELDTENFYTASIPVTENQRDPIEDEMVRAMAMVLDLVKRNSRPSDGALEARAQGIERRLRSANIRARTEDEMPEELPFDASKSEADENALNRIESAVLAVESIEAKDAEIVARQKAYHRLLGQYERTLRQTKSSLAAVEKSLDQPAEFNLQANYLLDTALNLRDAFAEYKAAR